MSQSRQGQAGVEIDVTPEMVEAGVSRLSGLADQALDYAAEEAYRAMELARRAQARSTGSSQS